jgi:NOL1/NOP2/sun family putative RNA methylase
MKQLPIQFLQRLQQIVPVGQFDAIVKTFAKQKPISFRINNLKANHEEILTELKKLNITPQPVTWYQDAFIIPAEQKSILTTSELMTQGKIYIQALASMLPPLILNPQPDEEILDLTAAPGSKTTQLACLMKNTGRIAAVEKVKSRFFKLKDNCEQQAVTCVHTYLKDGANVWRSCPERFDRVLLDAPCSSEGRFNLLEPKSFQYWSEKKIKEMARKQWRLLYSAWQSLKPGGVLVYATCTFAPEENECQIARLVKKFGSTVKIMPITLTLNNTQPGLASWNNKDFSSMISHCIRILPEINMGAFFIAKLLKNI